jgi:hypothetical protein
VVPDLVERTSKRGNPNSICKRKKASFPWCRASTRLASGRAEVCSPRSSPAIRSYKMVRDWTVTYKTCSKKAESGVSLKRSGETWISGSIDLAASLEDALLRSRIEEMRLTCFEVTSHLVMPVFRGSDSSRKSKTPVPESSSSQNKSTEKAPKTRKINLPFVYPNYTCRFYF